jgi:hypothetical protein
MNYATPLRFSSGFHQEASYFYSAHYCLRIQKTCRSASISTGRARFDVLLPAQSISRPPFTVYACR